MSDKLPRMDYRQHRRARRLVHECCNYDEGNCLLLDDGEPCVCVQSIASCSELENETNPLSFSDIQMMSRMVWMMPSSSPTIRASPPIRPPMMMLSAKIPTVPDMP